MMSRLAEVYDGGKTRLSAADIAETRGLSPPFVSKILSILSQAGLVTGLRGPGGGSVLSRDPASIKIFDVFKLFERIDEADVILCPFGGERCGVDDPCPLHERLVSVNDAMARLLHETTFEEFHQPSGKSKRSRPSSKKSKTSKKKTSH